MDSGGWTQTGTGSYYRSGATVIGVTSITHSTDWSYGTASNQTWSPTAGTSSSGAWVSSGNSKNDSYSSLCSSSSSGIYTISVSNVTSVTGTIQQNSSLKQISHVTDSTGVRGNASLFL